MMIKANRAIPDEEAAAQQQAWFQATVISFTALTEGAVSVVQQAKERNPAPTHSLFLVHNMTSQDASAASVHGKQ